MDYYRYIKQEAVQNIKLNEKKANYRTNIWNDPICIRKKTTNMQKKKIIYEQKFLEGYIRNLTLVIITSH